MTDDAAPPSAANGESSHADIIRAQLASTLGSAQEALREQRQITEVIAALRQSAASDAEAVAAAAATAATALGSLTAAIDDVEASRLRAAASRDQTLTSQAAVATAEESTKRLVAMCTEASKEITGAIAPTASNAQKCADHATAAVAARAAIDAEVTALRDTNDRAAKFLKAVEQHTAELEAMRTAEQDLLNRITALLPRATSASLATAFAARRGELEQPLQRWTRLFYLSIGALVLAATLLLLPHFSGGTTEDWRQFLLTLPLRAIVFGALIWLAHFASSRFEEAQRVAEDYAFKEAISTAFEGYRREMMQVGTSASELAQLLSRNTIAELAERPGRLYDKPHQAPPFVEALQVVVTAVERMGKDAPAGLVDALKSALSGSDKKNSGG